MADRDARPKVPKAKVEPSTEPERRTSGAHMATPREARSEAHEGGSAQPGAGQLAHEAEAEAKPQQTPSVARAREGVRAWLHETFPGHEHAVTWGFVGFLVAILFFIIGFWRTLVVLLLVFVGVTFGQVLDGDPKIINTLRGLFSGDNGR